ncbi:MAG: DUF3347 domain-containing protein [Bacteroidota bacterium]|nr:DUF3347 domain-containing protein [Bacteroidota bacterium]
MKTLAIMLLAALSWGSLLAQTTSEVFGQYVGLKNSLVDGDAKKSSVSASALLKSFETMTVVDDQKSRVSTIMVSLGKIKEEKKLEAQRAEFAKLSESFWQYLQGDQSFKEAHYYIYCPMKKWYWVSESSTIRNPFYGKQMLSCGKVELTGNN